MVSSIADLTASAEATAVRRSSTRRRKVRAAHAAVLICAALTTFEHARATPQSTHASLFVQVSDRAGSPVRDLAAVDFDVRIGGRSRAVHLVRAAPAATVVLLLDISGSLRDEMLDRFADAVVALAPDTRGRNAQIAVFASRLEWMPQLGLDRPAIQAFMRNARVGTPTALWDTVQAVTESRSAAERCVIVIASDGHDSMSRIKAVDLTRLVLRHNVQIHGIALTSVALKNSPFTGRINTVSSADFKRLVSTTGGTYAELKDNSRVAPAISRAFMNIDAEIELQVDVAGLDQKAHDVRVQVKRPGMIVRAPRSVVLAQNAR